ncbi:reverse transcriptase domain-containing protein [Belliella sp. DSM 107340]|uniref:Reverse transcriptase domain-containing protein n=1 Tax=Belliella calami TaxID=2923436 RepID=A0ABS9UTJ5_9BACT|nr:reverse transcriptase domain-containing protein [Belliella calami]MCH7399947.1 reverse transcriptase domain-containing protein [Belliella calami]
MSIIEAVKAGEIKIYSNPFRSKADGQLMGIPQGLPISAVLANMYLLKFDLEVVNEVVIKRIGYYRRYSDDILVVIKKEEEIWAKDFITKLILEREVIISEEKTEIFHFKKIEEPTGKTKIIGFLKKENAFETKYPLNYLGFDFYGHKTLIASKNLSKFYRRMKTSIKKKVKIAEKKTQTDEHDQIVKAVFKRQLYRIFTNQNLNSTSLPKKRKRLVKNIYGYYKFKTENHFPPFRGNYLTYIKRASNIMNEPAIEKQLRNHKKIFNKYLKKRVEKQKIHF